ncbi:hypothetical protein M513_08532 [Trichuris suis]|uniref:Uncharacterized protein n=1 Tax=Trichuris suis TaxID=68888 RepID=A0A085M037_9BILA|nr:hypothetical protein M513_08532 [Trichuris suis]
MGKYEEGPSCSALPYRPPLSHLPVVLTCVRILTFFSLPVSTYRGVLFVLTCSYLAPILFVLTFFQLPQGTYLYLVTAESSSHLPLRSCSCLPFSSYLSVLTCIYLPRSPLRTYLFLLTSESSSYLPVSAYSGSLQTYLFLLTCGPIRTYLFPLTLFTVAIVTF